MFAIAFKSIFSLCLMMFFGFYFYRKKILHKRNIATLSYIMLNLALPCVILSSMQAEYSGGMAGDAFFCFAAFAGVQIFGLGLGFALVKAMRLKPPASGAFMLAAAFPNSMYMGFPVIESFFGQQGLFLAAMCSAVFNILCFTLGIAVIGGAKRPPLRVFLSPALVASAAGFLMFVFSVRIWEPVNMAVKSIGAMTTPLSMLIIGAMLAGRKPGEVFLDARLYVLSAVRLLAVPLAVFFALRPFVESRVTLITLTLLAGMPSAAATAILAKNYGGDAETASKAVFITTALSLATIPALAAFIQVFTAG